jgi:hypothetical protein
VFRNEGDGCLTSKYVNDASSPFTESCKLVNVTNPNDPFEGIYRTAWLERDGDEVFPRDGTLKIGRDQNNNYHLHWRATAGQSYEGVGMLFNDFLVASYWSLPRNSQQ